MTAQAGAHQVDYDVLVIGGGPAGLSAALNLGRSLMRVLVIDADRPRNAATLNSHGFLTRDGVPPFELRKIARAELEAYPEVRVQTRVRVFSLRRSDAGFTALIGGRAPEREVTARSVLVATGLRETLPEVPNLRGFYGISLFSCAACDGWELKGRRLALIGESADLADRARLIARWTAELTVFTHGSAALSTVDEAELAAAGVRTVREPIVELIGERGRLDGIRVQGDETLAVQGGFVRPQWDAELSFAADLGIAVDAAGQVETDRSGRTSVAGVYAAGDVAAPGPQQLIVAAGAGARVAAVIVHDTVGVTTAH